MEACLCCLAWESAYVLQITWKGTADRSWKMANNPCWDALWKDLTNSTNQRFLNICIHGSDLSLLLVIADRVWLIELLEQWPCLPLWSPGKISRKHVQSVAIGSSFAMPENSLDPNGITVSSAWKTPTRPSPSAVNKHPAQPVPMAKTPAATMPTMINRGLAIVKPHWVTVGEAQNNSSLPSASSGTPCVPQPGAVGLSCQTPIPLHHNLRKRVCSSHPHLVSAWTTTARCQGMLTSPTLMMMMMMMMMMVILGTKELLDFRQWLILRKVHHRLSRQRQTSLGEYRQAQLLICFSSSEACSACLADTQRAAKAGATDA